MSKVIMAIGLPASGKTTWAQEYQEQNPNIVRINKDTLRAMLFGEKATWTREIEEQVCADRDSMIDSALLRGYDVVVDDTNFEPKHRTRIEEIASLFEADVEIQDFRHVPLEICLERDRNREKPVGEQVIRDMHKRYLKQD